MNQSIAIHKSSQLPASLVAWASVLLVSLLPDILFRELTGSQPAWLYWSKVGLSAVLFLGSLAIQPLKQLRPFFLVVIAVFILDWGSARVFQALNYQSWFVGKAIFVRDLATVQIPRFTSSVLLTIFMLVLTGSFAKFFFVPGNLKAPAKPIPLILDRPPTWQYLGVYIAAAMSLGLGVFVFVFGKPPALEILKGVVPFLPWVALFAMSNAYGEEMMYRAPWLATLEGATGSTQALLMTAVYFGIAHFYGVPYGITGVIMAFIPGWLMGKAMLETRGFWWAWFIHFCMDFVIFFFIALGSVRPGG